jgi:hypothetical protein
LTRALVRGGYGTFGTLVCRELARLGVGVTVAGRDRGRAEALARALGPGHGSVVAEAREAASCRAALPGHKVAVQCAGPFSTLGSTLLDACLEEGCHLVDIADDRAYVGLVRDQSRAFRARGLAAVYGCSSLPGLSGALAVLAAEGRPTPPKHARITLFIGNRNPKGEAAIAAFGERLGRPISAPQGVLLGFRDREVVALPAPFLRRSVYNFDSPDYDLLPEQIGVRSVTVKVGFERRGPTLGFAILARLGLSYGAGAARFLARIARMSSGGSSGGVVLAELFWADGVVVRAGLYGAQDGQRMAALPAALAVLALAGGSARSRGALAAHELLGPRALVSGVVAAGFHRIEGGPPLLD